MLNKISDSEFVSDSYHSVLLSIYYSLESGVHALTSL